LVKIAQFAEDCDPKPKAPEAGINIALRGACQHHQISKAKLFASDFIQTW
jgi:hypothetical protein